MAYYQGLLRRKNTVNSWVEFFNYRQRCLMVLERLRKIKRRGQRETRERRIKTRRQDKVKNTTWPKVCGQMNNNSCNYSADIEVPCVQWSISRGSLSEQANQTTAWGLWVENGPLMAPHICTFCSCYNKPPLRRRTVHCCRIVEPSLQGFAPI